MARGKAPESEALKNAVIAYEALTNEDKIFFRNKMFSKLYKGLDKEVREEFKKELAEFIAKIEKAQEAAKQMEAVNALTTEQLEAILKARKGL